MKTNTQILKDNKVKVKVDFTKEEVNKAIAKKYKELAGKYKFPGFRNGKAPRPVVDALFGKEGVMAQVTDDIINNNYPLSIDDANIFPVGQGDFGKEKAKLVEQNKEYSYAYTVEVEPEYEMDNFDNVKIEMPSKDVTENDIDNQITQMQQYYYNFVEAKDTEKAKEDSSVVLDIKSLDDDKKEIESLTSDKFNYQLGSKFLPEEFESKLIGLKKGDKAKFRIDVPEQSTVYTNSLKDKTKKIAIEFKVVEIKNKVYEEVNDEWAKKYMGIDTVKEMRDKLKDQIATEKERMIPVLKENKCMDVLSKRIKDDVSKTLVDKKEAELLQDFFTQLQQRGLTFDQYLQQQNLSSDKFKEDIKKQAKDVVKQDVALDSYARKNKIDATQEDLENEFKLGDPKNWKKLYKQWEEKGELHTLRRAVIRMKAAKEIVAKAEVTEVEEEKKETKKKTTAKRSTAKKTTKSSANKKADK